MSELLPKKKLLRPLSIAGLSFLFVHFLMTIGYTVHSLNIQGYAKTAVQSYMTPMFHQGWQLFAPDVPGFQYHIHYRAYDNASWGDWLDASHLEGVDHRKMPYAAQKIAKQVANQFEGRIYYVGDQAKLDKIKSTGAYYRAVYFCSQHHKLQEGNMPDSVQMGIDFIITPDFHSGVKEVEDLHFEFEPDGL